MLILRDGCGEAECPGWIHGNGRSKTRQTRVHRRSVFCGSHFLWLTFPLQSLIRCGLCYGLLCYGQRGKDPGVLHVLLIPLSPAELRVTTVQGVPHEWLLAMAAPTIHVARAQGLAAVWV